MAKTTTFAEAAERVLEEAGQPLHANEIAERALDAGLVTTTGKTPEATFNAILAVSLKNKGDESPFVRVSPATFGLRRWVEEGRVQVEPAREGGRVRVAHYPTNEEARAAIQAWDGLERSAITAMRTAIWSSTGTWQENLDWTDPDEWIDERLEPEHREAARTTWEKSGRVVNPRHTTGVWMLIGHYDLLVEDPSGILAISEAGKEFLADPDGPVVQQVDEAEGLLMLLGLISDIGPAAPKDLFDRWMEFLAAESRIRSTSAGRAYLHARIRNLHQRKFVDKVGTKYAVTDSGVAYLGRAGVERKDGDTPVHELIKRQAQQARDTLRDLLAEIDPIAFEHVVKDLLEAMGYTNVQVTAPSGDKGVDVIGEIELGITSVKEVVQVKRQPRNVQRSVLDALRGCLHRFSAVRGTIITTGDFARGTREAAFEPGAAPITLINGEKLIDLLIEHELGVKKRPLELLEVDPSAFQPQDEENTE